MANYGKITQVIGPVVDVAFDGEGSKLPNILDSLEVTKGDGTRVVLECQNVVSVDRFPVRHQALVLFVVVADIHQIKCVTHAVAEMQKID